VRLASKSHTPTTAAATTRASGHALLLQTLVHECPGVEAVAVGTQQLGDVVGHGRPLAHVRHAGADRHHLGDLLFHGADLAVLPQHLTCRAEREREREVVGL